VSSAWQRGIFPAFSSLDAALYEGEKVKAEYDQEEKKVEVGVKIQSYGLPFGRCVTSDRLCSTLRNKNSTCTDYYSPVVYKKHPPACETFAEG